MSLTIKLIILFLFIVVTCIGFMIKLPVPFRAYDKMLHSAFYFLAAVFLHFLFPRKSLLILIVLVAFGFGIEHAQEYSNKLIGKRIHGRFDIEDVKANLKGLGFYVVFLVFYFSIKFSLKKTT